MTGAAILSYSFGVVSLTGLSQSVSPSVSLLWLAGWFTLDLYLCVSKRLLALSKENEKMIEWRKIETETK